MVAPKLIALDASTARAAVVNAGAILVTTGVGAIFLLALSLLVDSNEEKAGFFAAYSIYGFFVIFGLSTRTSLVPLLGSTLDEKVFRNRSMQAVAEIVPIAAVICALMIASAPLFGMIYLNTASDATQLVATVSLAILGFSAFFQFYGATLGAVLTGARRMQSVGVITGAGAVVGILAAGCLAAGFGIYGASIGIALGSIVTMLGFRSYMSRLDF
ncbi:MAG: polysaccharide biosynthesis C-terminal domain-containing protein, partial [Thermoleophilaceae bacterium]|nr:polysaccharide biosynthesis C-terminal domain-containing protein [Thermoleophilaceae bacterium]